MKMPGWEFDDFRDFYVWGFLMPFVGLLVSYFPCWMVISMTFSDMNMGFSGVIWLVLVSPWVIWVSWGFYKTAVESGSMAQELISIGTALTLYFVLYELVGSGFAFAAATASV